MSNSRKRFASDCSDLCNSREQKRLHLIRSHPLGIKPWGNYYFDYTNSSNNNIKGDCRSPGLGKLAVLTDELLLEIFGLLSHRDLLNLQVTSRVLYCFAFFDDLWKTLVFERFKGNWQWRGNWRQTFLGKYYYHRDAYLSGINSVFSTISVVRLDNFYSDVLFQPFLCATTPMDEFIGKESIDRRANLSMDTFITEYAKPNKPVIITDVVTKWPAYKKWSMDYLVEKWGDVMFRAEAVDIKLREYARYAANNMDESPLYLFDKNFAKKCYGIENDYSVPEYFAEDFFKVLDENRPDYRWLIIGPSRAGSTFHKDPNLTSAWNAVITGSKKWIMYPPNILPPGVFTSDDEAEVTSPVSLMEWHLNFYKEAQKSQPRPLEGVCRSGEIIFVPNGWWHMVVNLEDSIAITQNFVGTHNLLNVLCFLRDKPDQISGFGHNFKNCTDIHQTFREAFRERYQGVLEKIEFENEERELVNKKNNEMKSMWNKVKSNNDNGNENSEAKKFSFNFGFENSNDDDDNDDEI